VKTSFSLSLACSVLALSLTAGEIAPCVHLLRGEFVQGRQPDGTLVAGDLVTLPVPFLDTAKPLVWKEALARLSKVKFERLV
jgi:hypothetical protein